MKDSEFDGLSETLSPVSRYVVAIALVVIAYLLRSVLLPVNSGVKFTTFYPAVTIAFFLGGIGPGIMAIALSAATTFYFFLPPYNSLELTQDAIISLIMFVVAAGICGYFVARMHQYRNSLVAVERISAKEKVDEANQNLSLAVEGAQLGIWRFSHDDQDFAFSDRFANHYGFPLGVHVVSREKLVSIIHPDDRDLVHQAFFGAIANRTEFSIEHRVLWPDGSEHWIYAHGRPLYTPDGSFWQMDGVSIDITSQKLVAIEAQAQLEKRVILRTAELAAANQALAELSRHDALTALHNRLACDERLRVEFERMKRTAQSYSILMLDIDFFKDVNDSCGHAVGDSVLKLLAKTLSLNLREYDFIARWGGEEFLILLPATEFDQACIVAEKLRCAVESKSHPLAGTVTVSIGVATAAPDDLDAEVTVMKADESLYEAKRSGRNRVVAKISPIANVYSSSST
jgi:diguanylate cyclase (GGDEF)-like protein/PAS domain S-box-containing protein